MPANPVTANAVQNTSPSPSKRAKAGKQLCRSPLLYQHSVSQIKIYTSSIINPTPDSSRSKEKVSSTRNRRGFFS